MHKLIIAVLLIAHLASAQTTNRGPQGQVHVPGVAKRPMTFEDMMHMKRLGSTAVSPDGKWLGYSVTSVDLEKNTRTPELFIQPIDLGNTRPPTAVGQPGDGGLEFAPDGKHLLFLSGRENGQQIWLADFDSATGATSNAKRLTSLPTEADNAKWSPDSKSIVFTSDVYPDCPAITAADAKTGDTPGAPADGSMSAGWRCNADRDKAKANSKVKAQIFTHLMYRHWNHYIGEKRTHLFLIDMATGAARDLVPNDPHDVPPDYPTDPLGCGCAFSPDSKELALVMKEVPDDAISTNSDIYTLDLTDTAAKPVKVSTAPGGDFSPAYSPDGKYLAWRSQARAGYESDRFRLMLYDRAAKTTKELLPKFDRWVDEFAWTPDSRNVVFVSGNQGEAPIFKATLEGKISRLPAVGEFSDLHPLPDGVSTIANRTSVRHPGGVVRVEMPSPLHEYDPQEAELALTEEIPVAGISLYDPIVDPNSSLLMELSLPPLESFWFTATDGTKIQASSSSLLPSMPAKNTRSSSSSTAGRRARGETRGPTAGTPNSSPPTATSSS